MSHSNALATASTASTASPSAARYNLDVSDTREILVYDHPRRTLKIMSVRELCQILDSHQALRLTTKAIPLGRPSLSLQTRDFWTPRDQAFYATSPNAHSELANLRLPARVYWGRLLRGRWREVCIVGLGGRGPGEYPMFEAMSSSDSSAHMRDKNDRIQRGVYRPSPLGTGLFLGLRALDPFFQYQILAHGVGSSIIHKLGGQTLPQGPPLVTNSFIDQLGLSPYRLVLLTMAIGSAVKQNYWLVGISNEELPPGTATPLLVGTGLYAAGIIIETLSEQQRKWFKQDPANKGRCYQGGLFALSRHINYFGYTLWRTGFAVAAAGWTWGAIIAAFFAYDFNARGIPVLDAYCQKRYGAQWAEYKRNVPYQFVPGVY
ncbi:hypothetical protein B0A49_01364 [Cryomyces minteri]|uniref:Uncharacterized protein n=1 Tax=Cryomyces minteri TaxID=331657 RepID=A0A4U0XW85_9PEZI|nr:hypothetical protein B0A49_01364 [Cryomyces minteri]